MKHVCHAHGCYAPCPPRYLMCPQHWRLVPREIQARVYDTVGKRNMKAIDATWAPWWRAQAKAIASVMERENVERATIDRYLNREMTFADTLEGRGEKGLPVGVIGRKP